MSNLIYALAYWWGAKQIIAGVYSQTQFFIVLPALLFSAQSCGKIFALALDISNARVASARLSDLLGLGPTDSSDAAAKSEKCEKDVEAGEGDYLPTKLSPERPGTSIMFQAYPTRPHIEVLQGINIKYSSRALLCPSGPERRWKVHDNILIGEVLPTKFGSVEIDGRDLLENEDTSFRDNISLVPKDSTLFDVTIRFNIALGSRPDREATDEEIENACRLANIHDLIAALPQGYDTRCGSNGDQFSAGQNSVLQSPAY